MLIIPTNNREIITKQVENVELEKIQEKSIMNNILYKHNLLLDYTYSKYCKYC